MGTILTIKDAFALQLGLYTNNHCLSIVFHEIYFVKSCKNKGICGKIIDKMQDNIYNIPMSYM